MALTNPMQFISKGGEMGAFIRLKDWSKTSVGTINDWPQSLRTTLGIILNSRFPMLLLWGPELICFYNDVYKKISGSNDNYSISPGQCGEDFFADIWPTIKPQLDQVLESGEAIWNEEHIILLNRNNQAENNYCTFSYSPVIDETNTVAGVFVTCIEATATIINDRDTAENIESFRSLINEAPVATSIFTGSEHIIEVANEEALKLWGKDKRIIGKTIAEAIPELKGQPYLKILDNVYHTGETYEGNENLAYLEINGSLQPVYVNFIYKALRDKSGGIYGILCMGYDVTEQVESRKKITTAEERIRLATEAAMLGTFDVNLVTDEIVYSKRLFEIFGYDNRSATRQELVNAIHPDDIPLRDKAYKDLLKTGALSYEARVIWPDKSIHWIKALGTILYDEYQKPVRLLGTIIDITESKVLIESLEKTRNQLAASLSVGLTGTWIWDIEKDVVITDRSMASMFNVLPEEAEKGLPIDIFLNAIHDNDREKIAALIEKAVKEKGVFENEYRVVGANGIERWVIARGKVEEDEEGNPVRFPGILIDISERKKVEFLLKEQESLFRNMSNHAPVIIWTTNAAGQCTFVNQQWTNLTGQSQKDFELDGWIDVIHPDDVKKVIDAYNQADANHSPMTVDYRIRSVNGEYRWIIDTGIPRFDESGAFMGYIGSLVDITERKETEMTLRISEERFRNTVMHAPVGIAILRGPQFIAEMANEAYLQLVDSSESNFVGKPLFDSLPEVKNVVEPLLNNVLHTGQPFHGTELKVILNRYGKAEDAFFNLIYQPLFENDGSISGIVVVANEVTQQVESKRSLAESEKQFRNLVTQSPIAMTIFKGKDHIIDIANEAMLKNIWRRELHEVQGRRALEVFPELKDQPFAQLLKDVFETGKPYTENEAVAYVDTPDGMKKYYLDFEYAPLFEIDKTVGGIMITVNDVTEKVEARQQIKDAVDRLSLATEGTQLAVWDLDLQTREIIYSPRLAKIFGYEDSKVLTHAAMREHIHPDDIHTIVEKAFEKALEKGVYYYESRIVHPDKSIHWIRTHGKILYDHTTHKPLRMLGTMMDITEQKRSEQIIEESERKFKTLANSMPQFIWTSNAQGNLDYFSESVFVYSGLTSEQIFEQGWLQIVHPEDREENINQWMNTIKKGEPFLFEHRFRRYDGEYRWQLSRAVPQKDASGNIQMWVGTSTDIHDKRLFTDELENQVQQRTKELNQLNEELIKSNGELAQFAYVASHDLQEPLRKIQTFASRILDFEKATLSEKGYDYFRRMQGAAVRMQQLILDLLSYSRANTTEKHFELVDLDEVLETVLEQLKDTIDQKQAIIKTSNLPTLYLIPFQFEQLLTNIISNALKFSKKDKIPVIEIKASIVSGKNISNASAENNNYHYISISDNGIGFEPEFGERIFQVFQRLHGREEYPGTGIGLAICKRIVENHQGIILATSKPNAGATFHIYIPVS